MYVFEYKALRLWFSSSRWEVIMNRSTYQSMYLNKTFTLWQESKKNGNKCLLEEVNFIWAQSEALEMGAGVC